MHIEQQLILDILFCFIIQCREMCSLHSKPRYIPYTTSLDKHTHIHTYTRHTLTHTLYFCLSVSLSASQVYAFSLWPHPVDHLLQSSSLPILHACHFISSTPLPPLPLSLSSAERGFTGMTITILPLSSKALAQLPSKKEVSIKETKNNTGKKKNKTNPQFLKT